MHTTNTMSRTVPQPGNIAAAQTAARAALRQAVWEMGQFWDADEINAYVGSVLAEIEEDR